MKKIRLILDTKTQLDLFVSLCGKQSFPVYLSDGSNEFRVSAKSTLGCILAKTEWKEIYCEYDVDEHGIELERELAKNKLTNY